MANRNQQYLREQLIRHIEGGEAFKPIKDLLENISYEKLGVVPDGLPYSLWQMFYHIRFAQYDILEFSRSSHYEAIQWPDDYWPESAAPGSHADWDELVKLYYEERREFIELIENPSNDLFEPFPHGNGQTLFREALLIIEHTAYHTGELLVIMRSLGIYN